MSKKHKKTQQVVVDIPPRLQVDPLFIKELSLPKEELAVFLVDALKSLGYSDIKFNEDPKEGYIFAKGIIPVCLCAHMDKVPHYQNIKTINRTPILNAKNVVIDVFLSSKQGIGGDDRCGVYAITSMLKLGHRPSVLFCMGEEIGCCGSHKFCKDFPAEFLSDVNAFIQIDRRGSNDCVRYSDQNHELTNAICDFDFSPAFGSCSDISVLMPHFGISGVNLSSGYYNEHNAKREYVSVKDVKILLKRLNKILQSNIFNKRYEYKAPIYTSTRFTRVSSLGSPVRNYQQVSLLEDYPYEEPDIPQDDLVPCEYCGELYPIDEMVETDNTWCAMVCPFCAEELVDHFGYVKCSSCGSLYESKVKKNEPSYVVDSCPLCGCINDR